MPPCLALLPHIRAHGQALLWSGLSPAHPGSPLSTVLLSRQLNSPMNPVSSSEDIKPPLGLNGVLKVPAHPSGTMASFTKHICAICGDRSSGKAGACPGRGSRRRVDAMGERGEGLHGSLQHSARRWGLSIRRGAACAIRGRDEKSLIDQPPPARLVWGRLRAEPGDPRSLLSGGVMSSALSSTARLKTGH